MPIPKSAPKLGFDLEELEAQVEHYEVTPKAARGQPTHSNVTAVPLGRPRTLPRDAVTFSVRISPAQRDWLVREAAQRTLDSGERYDTSMLVRELIDQARGRPS